MVGLLQERGSVLDVVQKLKPSNGEVLRGECHCRHLDCESDRVDHPLHGASTGRRGASRLSVVPVCLDGVAHV